MAKVSVEGKSENSEAFIFNVEVVEGNSKTVHTVEVDRPYYERLTGGKVTPAELVEKSFSFLLRREPKESILRRFNLEKIAYYFPEYEDDIKNYL